MIMATRSFVMFKLIEMRYVCYLLLLLSYVGCMFSLIKNTHTAHGVVYVRVLYAGCVMKKKLKRMELLVTDLNGDFRRELVMD